MNNSRIPDSRAYEALRSKDRRFDGVFFVGVTSTGIFCRPVCPSRTPKEENCRFFASAVHAQIGGFRPCLRCRPEMAPARHREVAESLAMQLTRLLRTAALEGKTLTELAQITGWSPRQFRRRFHTECGIPPVAMMQAERLLFAKLLLHETTLPLADVALSAGFRSVRRFNAVFAAKLGMAPGRLRGRQESTTVSGLSLRLEYREPFAWKPLLGWMRARATDHVERVTDNTWARTVRLGDATGWIAVTQDHADDGALRVTVSPVLVAFLPRIVRGVRDLFDLDANPAEMASVFGADPLLGAVHAAHPGLRVPGAWDVFESAVRAVLGQQISVAAASTIAGRLAWTFGRPCEENPHGLTRFGMMPETLAQADFGAIAQLGLPGRRAATLQALARFALQGGFERFALLDFAQAREALLALPGIGPWTAEYIALRALRFPDAFPSGDLGLRKALGGGKPISPTEAERRSLSWQPWRAYAAALLWQLPTP